LLSKNEKKLEFVLICHLFCFFFQSWELAFASKESKQRFDAAGVKLVAVGVGIPDKARILIDRVGLFLFICFQYQKHYTVTPPFTLFVKKIHFIFLIQHISPYLIRLIYTITHCPVFHSLPCALNNYQITISIFKIIIYP
jgi:hypothetical protein